MKTQGNSKQSTRKYSDTDLADLKQYLNASSVFTHKMADLTKFIDQNSLAELIAKHPYYEIQNGLVRQKHEIQWKEVDEFFLSYKFKGQYEFYYGFFDAKTMKELVDNLIQCYLKNKDEHYKKSSLYSLMRIKSYLSTRKDP